ncbi:GNAT family N-acetyltransferase [Streptomyces sp. NPDC001691]|uniref:GNAT family N-acetyltransferase n=1 Tax=Streptomyces sp. NPDC001691 TaxID=3364600 RepID=UPI00369094CA
MPHVREMTEADVEAVSALRVRGWQSAYAGIVPQPYLDAMSIEDDARRRKARLSDPRRQGVDLVVETDATAVGWVSFGPYRGEALEPGTHVAEVFALYVHPDRLGRGAGRALLGAAHQRARAEGFGSMALWVLGDNGAARRFYERAGYTADGGEQADAYGDVVLTELRYRRPLEPPPLSEPGSAALYGG